MLETNKIGGDKKEMELIALRLHWNIEREGLRERNTLESERGA